MSFCVRPNKLICLLLIYVEILSYFVISPLIEKSTTSQSKKRITEFFKEKKDKDNLEVVLSRMVSLDGLSFRVFTTSRDLRNALKPDGYEVPKSPTTIRNIVMEFAEKTRNQEKTVINQLVQKCDRFCISHDEWLSMKTRRYLNIL